MNFCLDFHCNNFQSVTSSLAWAPKWPRSWSLAQCHADSLDTTKCTEHCCMARRLEILLQNTEEYMREFEKGMGRLAGPQPSSRSPAEFLGQVSHRSWTINTAVLIANCGYNFWTYFKLYMYISGLEVFWLHATLIIFIYNSNTLDTRSPDKGDSNDSNSPSPESFTVLDLLRENRLTQTMN